MVATRTARGVLWAILPVIAVLCVLPGSAAGARTRGKTVEATGRADGTDVDARNQALEEAMRSAVEKAAGTFITSQTEVSSGRVVYDRIMTQASGYISDYDVIDEGVDNNGFYFVTIKARVSTGKFEQDWLALALLMERKGKPRVAIVAADMVDEVYRPSHITETAMIREFRKRDFKVIDLGHAEKLYDKVVFEAFWNPDNVFRIVKKAERQNAELLLLALAQVDRTGTENVSGRSVYLFQGNAEIKVLRADTAEVLLAGSVEGRGSGLNYKAAAKDVIRKMAGELSTRTIKKIGDIWSKDVQQGAEVTVVVKDVVFRDLMAFENAMRRMHNISLVVRRRFVDGTAELGVTSTAIAQDLAVRLQEIEDPIVEVIGQSQNTVTVKVRLKPEVEPKPEDTESGDAEDEASVVSMDDEEQVDASGDTQDEVDSAEEDIQDDPADFK